MKYFLIILLLCATGFSLMHNHAYGLWIPQSPDDLLKQSQTIFVGNITSIKVLEFAKSSVYHTEENGIERQIIENYTLALDEYTVNVEQFLKNPQNSDTMVVRQPTTSIPGMVVPIDGFEVGDRVLFYVEKIDNENTYSPESFEIPTLCDANVMLSKPRFAFGSDMKMMQNGVQMSDNFTAGIPIKFVYGNDVRMLEGKGFDIDVGINMIIDNKAKPIFREKLRAEAEPCEWIASTEWAITPQAGKHSMAFTVYDDDGDAFGHSEQFFVKGNTSLENDSPLKQLKSGISIDKIQCKEGLELVLKSHDGSPACVRQETKAKLIGIGWMKTQVNVHDDSSFIESTKNLKEVQLFLSLHPDAKANVNHEWFTVEYEKSGFREYSASRIIQHAKQLIIGLDYEGRPSAHTMICGGPVSLETGNMTFLENPDWCFPLDQSRFNSIKQENENDIRMDCNNRDGRVEAQCFKDSLESCVPAITHSVIYTLEGDALYLEAIIADDCKIHVTFDNSGDRFGGSDKGINSYVCNNVELHEKHIWVIDDCAGYPEFQINYEAHEWASHQKCTDLGGVWNYTFHNCVGIFDETQCQKSGGTIVCMSYEQMGHSRDVCQRVCEFEPADRK